jgi:hypothetical protein
MKTLVVAFSAALIFAAAASAGTAGGWSKAHSTDETVTVSSLGTGTGTITSTPAGIDCPTVCSASFPDYTNVILHETPDSGSTADGYSPNCQRLPPPGKTPGPVNWFGSPCRVEGDAPVKAIFNLVTTPCLVPLNRGRTVDVAKFRLELASCQPNRFGVLHYAFSRTIRKGRVLFQNPRSGTQLNHRAMVGLVVSEGRPRR